MAEQKIDNDPAPKYDRLGTGGRSHYDVIKDAVDKVDCYADQVNMLITVLDYDYPYDLHFDISLKTAPGYARFDVDEFLGYIDNLRDVGIRSQTVNETVRRQYIENGWDEKWLIGNAQKTTPYVLPDEPIFMDNGEPKAERENVRKTFVDVISGWMHDSI